MAENFTTQAEFKAFERQYNKIRRSNRNEREDAVGLLTPQKMRQHIRSGQDLVLDYGRQGKKVVYTLEELKQFADAIEKTKKISRNKIAGAPLLYLEKASLPEDHKRSRAQIRNATLYRVQNNMLHFQVTASDDSDKQYHQVRIRLEEWFDQMTDPRTWLSAARNAAMGRMSFDCTCGRHQFWYRYLATIGGFAVAPLEKDFPKIRNPRLTGCCCKHVLKVLRYLKSPSVHAILAKHMEKQSEAVGYADKPGGKFLRKAEIQKAKRARGSDKQHEAAKRAYEDFKKAKDTFKRKAKTKEAKAKVRALTAKLKAQESRAKAAEKKIKDMEAKAQRDVLAGRLSGQLSMAKKYKLPREDVLKDFAEENEMKTTDVEEIVKEYEL
jgi:hypothetical protein